MSKRILRVGAGLMLLVVGLAGCAGIVPDEGGQLDPRQQVSERASARWNALIAGDLAKAYEYLSPGTRDVMTLDSYKAKTRPGTWRKAKVDTVTCEKDRCEVAMLIEHDYRNMKSIESRLNEVWLQDGGKWWFVPKK